MKYVFCRYLWNCKTVHSNTDSLRISFHRLLGHLHGTQSIQPRFGGVTRRDLSH